MKKVKLFEEFHTESLLNEGKGWAKLMKAVRAGSKSGPWTIVSFEGRPSKIVNQEHIQYMDLIPAHYEEVKKRFPNAKMSIEDNTGMSVYNESVVTEAKNTIGLAFKEEQDYLDFKEFVTEQPGGSIRKDIGWDHKTKSWEAILDISILADIYGEGHPGNKNSGWRGGLPGDFESVIIEGYKIDSSWTKGLSESVVTEEYDVSGISRKDLKDILNYLDIKDISYDFDGKAEILDFDMTELDKKGQAELKKLGINESVIIERFANYSLDENFPGPGETVDAKYLDYDMLDYFNRTNKVLSIDTKTKKGIKGAVGRMYGDLVFNGDDIQLKDIVRVKILESEKLDEAFIGPFVFNDTMSDKELKAMYDGALDGYANWQKSFQHPKAKYKQAYQEIEKLLKKRGVTVDESKYNGNIAGDAAESIAKELSHYVKGIIDQSNKAQTYFHVKDQLSVNKTIQTLRDVYGIEAASGGNQFAPSHTVKFDNDQLVESLVTEGETLKKGDIVKFKDGRSIYIVGPKGGGYDYKDGREIGHHPKGWFDMMISTGKAVIESVVTEGREANQFGIESQHIGKLQDGKLSKYTEGNGMPFGLISRPETGLSDTDKNAVKDYVNADNIVLGFYPMEDSNNDTMYNAVKSGGIKIIEDLVSNKYGLELTKTIKGKRHCAGDTCSLMHYLVFSKTNEAITNEE